MSKYDDLTAKLREIFQIDRPELDFGIYRIIGARADEINDYLNNRLKARVQESLASAGNANLEQMQKELADAIKGAETLGLPPDNVPKVQELRQRITVQGSGAADHENAVFSHLLTFFSRYYDKGDFISQRRYKGDTYAIPYAGEEVVLHWANKDQYYTKSGENFANYSFKLADGRAVHFRLVAADTAKDNRKDNDKERCFVLLEPDRVVTIDENEDDDNVGPIHELPLHPVEEQNNELLIRFEYRPMPKGSKQDDLVAKAVRTILASLPHPHPTPPLEGEGTNQLLTLQGGGREGDGVVFSSDWKTALSQREPTEKKPDRTLLEKHLTTYTQRNTADYFIHKDLARFLKRELDFYIKNEVMHLDDLQHAEKFADIEKNLRMIQCLRAIALDLITFLAQLEDFQKKLWLKKKFVVAAHYCITLDRVIKDAPELLEAITAKEEQWQQWDQLGMLGAGAARNSEYLTSHPFLMVDTALFDSVFKGKLLGAIDNLDESLDGLLIHGDNFQALNLLQERYREQVKCVYIDPPYNTAASEIAYKNAYKHSSWLSLIDSRLPYCRTLMTDDSIFCFAIDDCEYPKANLTLQAHFGEENFLANVPVRSNPHGRAVAAGFSTNHEFSLYFRASDKSVVGRLPRNDKKLGRYNEEDSIGPFTWINFRKTGADSRRQDRPKQFYPVFANTNTETIRVPMIEWSEVENRWDLIEEPAPGEFVIFPIDDEQEERAWSLGQERARIDASMHLSCRKQAGSLQIYRKYRPHEAGALPGTWWEDAKYSATESGTRVLKQMFGEREHFSYPKSLPLVRDCLQVAGATSRKICLDFFAGSGTTGHAVINLNRQDNGCRKYILVEQGEYFDTVLKPRIQKVVYSAEWKDGKPSPSPLPSPTSGEGDQFCGISHAFKVLKIESYEDTLNNLLLRRTEAQQSLLDTLSQEAKDDYLLRYMLNIESQGSILSVDSFRKPFDCTLKVAVDSAGACEDRPIDLVETFNYLIGLRVKQIDSMQERGIVMVQGTLPTGEKTLVLWRDCEQVGYDELTRFCERQSINPRDSEFEVVYINGDHNIPSVLTGTDDEGGITKTLKLRQIEPEFLSRMFSGEA